MSARPSFDAIEMEHAVALARRSTCLRLQVGCVIASTDHRYVFGRGYNGGASGAHAEGCTGVEGACGCLHSEDNAVVNCTAPRSEAKLVYVTHCPCRMCAIRLVNLGGVQRVFYLEAYRDMSGARLVLDHAGIELVKFKLE